MDDLPCAEMNVHVHIVTHTTHEYGGLRKLANSASNSKVGIFLLSFESKKYR